MMAALQPLFDRFAQRMAEALAAAPAPGLNAAIIVGNEIVWTHAAGFARYHPDVPLTPQHLHRIGSITKLFTSHAILLLRDDGRLHLDDPVATYIPEFQPGEVVTLRHMLCHGSGISSEGGKDYWGSGRFPDESEFVRLIGELRPLLPPMTKWKYSNAAMSMLGLVVQRVSGMPYEQFVGQRLLRPMDMESAAFYTGPELAERIALGHYMPPFQRRWEAAPYQDLRAFNACGMLAATPTDLLNLARLQWSADSFLPAATRDEMHRLHLINDEFPGWQQGWGLGWRLTRHGDRVYAGHSGAYVGNHCDLQISVADQVGVALFASYGGAMHNLTVEFLTETIEALDKTRPQATPPSGEPIPPEVLPWLGQYAMGPWFEARLEFREGGPCLAVATMPGVRLAPAGPDRLRILEGRWIGEDVIVEQRDESGRVVALNMAGAGSFTRV